MARENRGRSRTPRDGASTVTSKSSLLKVDKEEVEAVIDRVPTAFDYHSACSEDDWLEEKSKASRYSVGGEANRIKSLLSNDDDDEEYDDFDEDGDENADIAKNDRYSQPIKEEDKRKRPSTIDRLWSASMDSDTQRFQGTAYNGSLLSFTGFDAGNKKNQRKQKSTEEGVDTMEPIYEHPKTLKQSMSRRLRNTMMGSTGGTVESQSKADKRGGISKARNNQREIKKKPTDEISADIDGSATSSLTDPLDNMLYKSTDPERVVEEIEQKLEKLRQIAVQVDKTQKSLNRSLSRSKSQSRNKSGVDTSSASKHNEKPKNKSEITDGKKKSKNSSRSTSRSRSSRSKSRSGSRSKSRSERGRSRSKTPSKNQRSSSRRKSRSKTPSKSSATKKSSSSKSSGSTYKSKTPLLKVNQSDAVFSNAPTEHRKNSTQQKQRSQPNRDSANKKSEKYSSVIAAAGSGPRKKSKKPKDEVNKNKEVSSSSRRKASSSRKSSESRSRSRSNTSRRKSGATSSSRRSRSSSRKSRSRSTNRERSRSRSTRSTKEGTRSRGSMSRKEEPAKKDSRKKKSKKFKGSKYLMDTDLKEESVERARYELTKEMIELLETVKLDEMRKNIKYAPNNPHPRVLRKRKEILRNFANFFRKNRKEELIIVSNPNSIESLVENGDDDNPESESGLHPNTVNTRLISAESDEDDAENDVDDIIRAETSVSPSAQESLKENNVSQPLKVQGKHRTGTNQVLGERNRDFQDASASKPLSAEKSKKASELRKTATKQAARRKLAVATKVKLEKEATIEEWNKKAIDEEQLKAVEDEKKKAGEDKKKKGAERVDEKHLNITTEDNVVPNKGEHKLRVSETKMHTMKKVTIGKKMKMLKKKKNAMDAISPLSRDTDAIESSAGKVDAVEESRSDLEWARGSNEQPAAGDRAKSSLFAKKKRISTRNKHVSLSIPDNESKGGTTLTTITKIPEHLIAKSNPLEIDEYSLQNNYDEPGMVQCLRFYSCGKTADVLNVAIKVSDVCSVNNHDDEFPNRYRKGRRHTSTNSIIDGQSEDAIMASRSMVNERECSSPKLLSTVEVILEDHSRPFATKSIEYAETVAPEGRDDIDDNGDDSDDDDTTLEEAPDLSMPRVHSFVLDVSQMTLHLDEDSTEKRTRDAIRRGIATADDISITSIQVRTKDTSENGNDDDSEEDANGTDDDDSSTESGILEEEDHSHHPELVNATAGKKGRVQKIFSRFRIYNRKGNKPFGV